MNMGMGMNMGPRQELRQEVKQELKLEQRLALKQKLALKLEKQLVMKITLEQYCDLEEVINGLIDWTNQHKKWALFDKNGFKFEYACVPYRLAEPIADKAGCGFAHCQYAPFRDVQANAWTLFVVENMVPKELIDFVALHERGEELSIGNHYFASQLEFAYVRKRTKIQSYINFIESDYPSKFTDLTQKVLFPILPEELIERLNSAGKRNQVELEMAEKLIEEYPLASNVLRRIDKYERATERVEEILRNCMGSAQRKLYEMKLAGMADKKAIYSPQAAAELVNNELSNSLRSIDTRIAHVVSRARVNEVMRAVSEQLNHMVMSETRRGLYIPQDFATAYKAAINNKTLVTAQRIVEDEIRDARNKADSEQSHSFAAARYFG